ncbi:UDP-N-acetylglucosamine 2-epimerase [Photobacterium damselae]|nr:UDP-N-acetylglucosamine 2-epimerase [Photobacterium damselae]
MMDPLFQPTHDNPYLDKKDERPTILMCSTFSRNLTCAPHLIETIKRLSQSGKWRWLIQFHPKMDSAIVEQYKALQGPNLTFVETDNVIPLLQAADVMLCDTSSVLLMFLLQRKPVVTFRNQSPKPHLINIEQANLVEDALTQALTRPPELMSEIEQYCQMIHPYYDGKSSERVLAAADEMIESGLVGLKNKPLNMIREFKMRKKLHFWGF